MKRGPKPFRMVNIKWSPIFAYAIGLLVSDGCLSKDGRHIVMTSKDRDLIVVFNKCLGLTKKISIKYSGSGSLAYYVQFGDVVFYDFLLSIGITSAKSKTISTVKVPKKYFFDYLRGYFDGDGCSYSYYDPIFTNSYRFYISFASGSERHIRWLRNKLIQYAKIKGSISRNRRHGPTNVQLKYAKKEAVILSKKMYYHDTLPCLIRKRLKINQSLRIIEE